MCSDSEDYISDFSPFNFSHIALMIWVQLYTLRVKCTYDFMIMAITSVNTFSSLNHNLGKLSQILLISEDYSNCKQGPIYYRRFEY